MGLDYSDGNKFKIGYGGSIGENNQFVLQPNGYVGIGTNAPGAKLHVIAPGGWGNEPIRAQSNSTFFSASDGTGAPRFAINNDPGPNLVLYGYDTAFFNFMTVSNSGSRTVTFNAGNVGIGTSNPTYKLSVNGTIRAKEVIVETNWADDVFSPGYALAPVAEVAQHIEREGHLPGVPAAATVAEQGISLGEMQTLLLRKIEELTLYVIQQDRELIALRQEVTTLKAQTP